MTIWQNEKYGIKIDCFALTGIYVPFPLMEKEQKKRPLGQWEEKRKRNEN
ncbi:MAG: hypothetical protein J5644_05965 [Bacteroidales bacterium]|nr:hypothetical protein [Bacteroidales bacterium]